MANAAPHTLMHFNISYPASSVTTMPAAASLLERSLSHALLNAQEAQAAVCVIALVFPDTETAGSSEQSACSLLVDFAVSGRQGPRRMLRERIIEHCLDPARFDMDSTELAAAVNDYAECLIEHMLFAAWKALKIDSYSRMGTNGRADAWCLPLGEHCIVAMAPLTCIAQVGEQRVAQLAHESILQRASSTGHPYDKETLKNYQQSLFFAN